MLYKRPYVNPIIDGKVSKCIEDNISKNVWHENITMRDRAVQRKPKKSSSKEHLRMLQVQEWIMPRH